MSGSSAAIEPSSLLAMSSRPGRRLSSRPTGKAPAQRLSNSWSAPVAITNKSLSATSPTWLLRATVTAVPG